MPHYDIYKKGFLGMKSKKIVLTLSDEGINYNSYLGNLGLILWKDIERISYEGNSIIILLKDIKKIEERLSSLNKKVVDLYIQKWNGHILIFSQQVNAEIPELYNLMLGLHTL